MRSWQLRSGSAGLFDDKMSNGGGGQMCGSYVVEANSAQELIIYLSYFLSSYLVFSVLFSIVLCPAQTAADPWFFLLVFLSSILYFFLQQYYLDYSICGFTNLS